MFCSTKTSHRLFVILLGIFVCWAFAERGGSSAQAKSVWVVCIDPGHQLHGNSTPEPIGPGSTTTKPCVSSGTAGALSGPEHGVNLNVGLKLRDILTSQGVQVVMTRTTADVDLCNSARAAIANEAKADLFIRLHCNAGGASARGAIMLYPARITGWTDDIATQSLAAAHVVQPIYEQVTGLPRSGTGYSERSDLSGFNWSDVPSILPEMLFQTNATDDALAADDAFRQVMAQGLADGIMAYLRQYAPLDVPKNQGWVSH
ncbi:MAG: N-acetylmuramoyl-L-alanine amidase [bacterium]